MLFAIGYIGATGYLVLRDDILRTSSEKQAQLQLTYEDRIANLRAQIDRLTSRSVMDRATLEERVDSLVLRQRELDERHARVSVLLAKAADNGITLSPTDNLPRRKPEGTLQPVTASAPESSDGIGGTSEPIELDDAIGLRGSTSLPGKGASLILDDGRDTLFSTITSSLDRMSDETYSALDIIAVSADRDSRKIERAASDLGIDLASSAEEEKDDGTGLGGPLVDIEDDEFVQRITRAETALSRLETLKTAAQGVPFRAPIEGAKVTSSFGPRLDPFIRRMAMHTGIDFRASSGTTVKAPASGRVTYAGRNGGYGLMVEIEHPSGIVSRFAHLRRILVKKGDELDVNQALGLVGSTGRSTGPHLHYELRFGGKAINPRKYLNAGYRIASVI
ncbi:peptidoglycan DD-metalloendopeptidase family protein [Stappia sp. GBMRC 2046]|uniref:Peptidoglycan DD-metalloendopeptidase family protein n=1 Tax=Stappia sediminis TaxID=2692190 RepID=A0A7X3LXN4_9HYPH|nr:M23 family metallopeptidase [Stappia sediminis]MXN67069.1 peptidoglycan DD-metalloendopeptidase family protein [Stappia sediminis]